MEHTSRSSPSHAPSPSAGVNPIHNIARTTFPVLAEPFLVDQNYEFVKELGQGALPLSWRRCERASGGGRRLTKDKDLRVKQARMESSARRGTSSRATTSPSKRCAARDAATLRRLSVVEEAECADTSAGRSRVQVTKVFQKKILTKRALREIKCVFSRDGVGRRDGPLTVSLPLSCR